MSRYSPKSGIAKRLVEVSEETIFSRCKLCIGMANTYQVHTRIQNERYIVSILPREIGDFDFRIKQKTLLFTADDFSRQHTAKIAFLFQCNAL